MSLYLVQHGKSLPKEVDPDSPLSEEGKTTVRRTAKAAGEYPAANVKPPKPTLNALKIAAPLVLAIFLWITVCGEVQGGTLYEYTDKDDAVVITDRPPPGVKATPKTSYPPITEEQKAALEREKTEQLQQNPKGDEAKKEKQKKIRAARAELKKAIRDEQHYRSNMNQSANYSQRHHWRLLVDEQEKVIAEKRKKIEDLESKP